MQWSAKLREKLKKLYPVASREAIEKAFPGCHWNTLRRRAQEMGLRRSASNAQKSHSRASRIDPEDSGVVTTLTIPQQVEFEREIHALEGEVKLLKAKNKALMKDTNLQERILEYVRTAVDALPPVAIPPPFRPDNQKTRESVVLVGSCWHIGEEIDPRDTGGINAYDFDVFVRRLQNMIERTIRFTTNNMRSHQFDEMHLILTGDMVSGIIHDLPEINCLNIVEQAQLGALVTAQAIQDLARVFPKVIVTGVAGNHGRIKQEKYHHGKQQVSWDYIFYETMALLLQKQKNVHFNIPLSYWAEIEIRGWRFLVQHGHNIKAHGGIPFYGIARDAGKWREIMASQGRHFDYYIASHFHTQASLQTPTGENILNGAIKGSCSYAISLALSGRPSQLLFGVHDRYAKTWELKINPAIGQDEVDVRYTYDRMKPLSKQLL